jgi:hypothetical protein
MLDIINLDSHGLLLSHMNDAHNRVHVRSTQFERVSINYYLLVVQYTKEIRIVH